MPEEKRIRDVVIVGGGPAGLTAGIYTSRSRLDSLLIEKGLFGGQITNAEWVENFPGFPDGISGIDLGQQMHDQAARFGVETIVTEVTGLELQNNLKVVRTTEGDFTTRAVILAGGSNRQKLGVPGEEEFIGKGVSYCATCDAAFFIDRPVAVAGGGDAAITEALHLAKLTSKVTVIHRRDQLRATKILQEKAFADPKIDFAWDSVVDRINGKDFVEGLSLRNVKTDQNSELEVAGLFVSIGFRPDTDYLKGLLALDDISQIITNEKMETGIAGIFAAGDIRQNSGRQAITAAGDGATSAIYVEKYLTDF
jgi:thioredoxin reductase (NADPH)